MEIVPLTEGETSGAEALRDGERVAHLAGLQTVQLWPRRGCRPTQLRWRRDVQPTA